MLSIKRREKNVSKLVSKFSAITTIIDHNFEAKEVFRFLHHKHLWYEWNVSFFVNYDTLICIFVCFEWNNFLISISKTIANDSYQLMHRKILWYYNFFSWITNIYLPKYNYSLTQVLFNKSWKGGKWDLFL